MSSKELPDVFTTRGWSVARYSEYLLLVNDLSFAADIKSQIKPIITDADGNMFVLPMDVDIVGMVYNVEVLEEAGVNPDDLKTWEDFDAACAKIKAAGKVPTASGNPAGLNGVESEIGDIAAYYDKYSSVETFPYFDRKYLPSGM